jgi:hypothetical protein
MAAAYISLNFLFLFLCRWQGILINGQFPGPPIDSVTNDNIIINVYNNLPEPFLLSWLVLRALTMLLKSTTRYLLGLCRYSLKMLVLNLYLSLTMHFYIGVGMAFNKEEIHGKMACRRPTAQSHLEEITHISFR